MTQSRRPSCTGFHWVKRTPEDDAWDQLFEDMANTDLTAAEARARWESQPDLVAMLDAVKRCSERHYSMHALWYEFGTRIDAALAKARA